MALEALLNESVAHLKRLDLAQAVIDGYIDLWHKSTHKEVPCPVCFAGGRIGTASRLQPLPMKGNVQPVKCYVCSTALEFIDPDHRAGD